MPTSDVPAGSPVLPPQGAPVCIYVAWHAKNARGAQIAHELFRWFRGDPRDLDACGTGIPVLFRAWMPGGAFGAEPAPLPQHGGLRVLVPLIDEHLVVDKTWRRFLHHAAGVAKIPAARLFLLPVALHSGAYQLAGALNRLNFVRTSAATPVATQVQSQVSDALARLLVARDRGFSATQFARAPDKISVFLSHAKRDGAEIASALRDAMRAHAQLDVFFDTSDLALGYDFVAGLEDELATGNTLLLALVTDAYAGRPWCRHEIRRMREVRFVSEPRDGRAGLCRIAPVAIVDALAKATHDHLPELGGAPVFRHGAHEPARIVDHLLRLVLQGAFDFQRAKALAERSRSPDGTTTWFVNAAPDLRTALQIRARTREKALRIVFPGPGVTADTLRDWKALLQDVHFVRFDDLEVSA